MVRILLECILVCYVFASKINLANMDVLTVLHFIARRILLHFVNLKRALALKFNSNLLRDLDI